MLCDCVADKVPDTKVEEAHPIGRETGSSLTAGDDEKATVTSLNDYAPRRGAHLSVVSCARAGCRRGSFSGPQFQFLACADSQPSTVKAPAAALRGNRLVVRIRVGAPPV